MARLSLTLPHRRLGHNVWELLRNGARILREFLGGIPYGALLIIAGGSPCQQLTMAGQYQGKQGLAGQQSIIFYALPVTARATTELRPDLR
eukprot:10056356-Lingulodinium_polyedra.AAC.1